MAAAAADVMSGSNARVEAMVAEFGAALASACEELIEAAKADGGYDNITVVIASF